MCNYISKLIPSLRQKCLTLHFYNIPNYKEYLNHIIENENIQIKGKH